MPETPVKDFVDHLFRRESGRMVAILTGIFGAQNLDLAEEVVQESLIEALRRWPVGGVPDNPAAWLIKVARNRALDRLRRRTNFDRKAGEVMSLMEARLQRLPEASFEREIVDDQLRLIFTCCHPEISPQAQIALTLKTVCGFSVREIAEAFLAKESTIAQRLTRAKRRIAEQQLPYSVPSPDELAERLGSVHKVLYLLFNEGYSPHDGDSAVRADICEDAVRLARLLAGHASGLLRHPAESARETRGGAGGGLLQAAARRRPGVRGGVRVQWRAPAALPSRRLRPPPCFKR